MGLAYPLASSPEEAMKADETRFAPTLADAIDKAGQRVSLVTDWIRSTEETSDDLYDQGLNASGSGFVQVYADSDGLTVLAVSFWKPLSPEEIEAINETEAQKRRDLRRENTDDLYFASPDERRRRFGRTRPQRRKINPNQMDLFPKREEDPKS